MKRIILHVLKFRALFVLLGVVGLLLGAVSLSAEGITPVTLFNWSPYPAEEGNEVTFSALATYDVYKWWKSDGPGNNCYVEDTPASTESTYTYTFFDTGDWQVCFEGREVTTGEPDVVVTDAQTVTINNLPPVIDAPYNWTGTPEPSVVGEAFHVEVPFTDYENEGVSCTINYGVETGELSGTIENISGNGWKCVGPNHTYTTAGQFDVRATVYDDYPSSSSTSDYYYHTVNAAEHLFSWDPLEPTEGGSATFTAVPGYISHYWTKGHNPGETCNSEASYYYTSPVDISFWSSGVYQVCLSMMDSSTYETVTDSQWVTVTNVAPSNIEVHTNEPSTFPGIAVQLYGYFTDYYDAPYSVEINWGDGSALETVVVNDTYLPEQPHTYAAVGTFTIQVSVTDKDGATGTGSTIQNVTTLMVEPEAKWMASNTLPTTILLQGAGITTETMSFSIASPPGYGSLDTPSSAECQPIDTPMAPVEGFILCKATVVYTPVDVPLGGIYDQFTYTISDGTNTSPAGTIFLWVGPNGAPVALDGEATVSSVSPIYVFLTATDPDIYDYYYDRITFTIDSQPENGTLGTPGEPSCVDSMNPITEDYESLCTSAVLFTPDEFTVPGNDSFTFHVNDTHQDSGTATVSLTLHAPVTLHVNSTDSGGDGTCDATHCSIREAVDAAMEGDIIDFTFDLPATIYFGGEQPLVIRKSVIIQGPGADLLAISGSESVRALEFDNSGQPLIASISGLTLKDGRADEGGGIRVGDNVELTVTDCVIGPNNIVTVAGGGIANMGGTLTLNRSTVVENHGTGTKGGAGIVTAWSGATTTLINSTVTGNVTNNYGGGILAAYGGRVNVIHSTISGNLANENYLDEAWGGGGGIAIIDDGMVSIQNSIVAGNVDLTDPATAGHPTWNDVSGTFAQGEIYGTFTSLGGNLIGDGTGSTGWGDSDQVGTAATPIDANLDSIGMYVPDYPDPYSLTFTFALLTGSPAIDAADCVAGIIDDQRGVSRPQGSKCDIGAFELEQTVLDTTPPEVTVPSNMTVPAANASGAVVTFIATAFDDVDGPLTPTCVPPSGSLFLLGTTPVTCSATDAALNKGSASFKVTVRNPLTLTVNTTDDVVEANGCDATHCSLREAILDAMRGDTIDFDLDYEVDNTITLTGRINIDKSLTIVGPGADLLAISGNEVSQSGEGGVFYVRGAVVGGTVQFINVSISRLTIRDGRAAWGGGIFNGSRSTLEMSDCVIGPNNIVTDAGGGIANNFGTLSINRCTIVENHGTGSTGGAGIFTANGSITLTNSTVAGNVTNNFGGGIYAGSNGLVNLKHVTVSGNIANQNYTSEAWGGGGGIYIAPYGSVSIQNSIVAGNTDMTNPATAGHAKWPDVYGTFSSLGGNLVGNSTGSSGWITGDLVGDSTEPIDPMLDPLDLNDPGTTPTFALIEGSPAINAVDCLAEVTIDQRGVTRPQGSKCDIGAFEFEQTVIDTTPPELTITGATADGTNMAGDLESGFILPTNNNPAFEHQIQFKSGSISSEALKEEHFGFILVDSTVSAEALQAYYTARGVPEPYLSYLIAAASGTNPFVMINGATVRLVDAAKYTVQDTDFDMAVPDDYPLGTYTVQGDIVDLAGNHTTVTLKLIVSGDRVPPVVTVPDNMSVPAVDASGAVVTFTATANDLEDGDLEPVCVPASGSKFVLGATSVTCTATDSAGNIGNASFTVTVTDQTPPVVTVPENMSVPASGLTGAVVTFSASANDNVDGILTPTCDPTTGSLFPIAITTVTCTATDLAGNIGSNSFTVTVVQSMHFSAISLAKKTAGRTYTITGLVTIRSFLDALFYRASVTVEWHLPNGLTMNQTALTDRNGIAKFVLRGLSTGTYEMCVENAVKAGWMYLSGTDNCRTITMP